MHDNIGRGVVAISMLTNGDRRHKTVNFEKFTTRRF